MLSSRHCPTLAGNLSAGRQIVADEHAAFTGRQPLLPHWNADYIEQMYILWKQDPESVAESWQMFFTGFEMGMCPRSCVAADRARSQSQVNMLIRAYRTRGHLVARSNPLAKPSIDCCPDLAPAVFGLSPTDMDQVFDTGGLAGVSRAALGEIIALLQDIYCGAIGVEFVHIQDRSRRLWLQQYMESTRNKASFDPLAKRAILSALIDADLLETFTHSRYPGHKRFSIEGGESLIPALHEIVELAPDLGVEEIVLAMAHRGRLNVLANILDLPYATIFSDFEGNFLPETVAGDGDVKYHRGYSSAHTNRHGRTVALSLTSNPSHLEAVYPVALGRTRAKQRQRGDTESRRKVVPVIIHGDAAFAGQGIVAETLNMSRLLGYCTGGTIHIIVNNQIGFTTPPGESRSTIYATDVAKLIEAPIFHVNGDDVEAVVFACQLALRYREEFGQDAVIDLLCYRRHGHNESDDPAFTQPGLYSNIKALQPVRRIYTSKLVSEGTLTQEDADRIADEFHARLSAAFQLVKETNPPLTIEPLEPQWAGLMAPYSAEPVATGVGHQALSEVARALTEMPDGFRLNPKIARQLEERRAVIANFGDVDWAFAEALAMGTLLREGVPVRLSGQDSVRGTFSQRHAAWIDSVTEYAFVPLNHISGDQAGFCAYNSPLSEASVLGFEYGYTLSEPRMLILWEAQFGDFANGAQVIIDQFLVSSQSKWQRTSGLVLLLPHGYEGQGPEHSNAYLERYLLACAENNIQVCNLTSPAQYFHALRRQMLRPFRRPLIIMAPKSLLRHKLAVSPLNGLIHGDFQPALDDPAPPVEAARLIFSSGKVFYDLVEERARQQTRDVALIRIEELYPFPAALIEQIVGRYSEARELVWAQEEPQNRGAWTYIEPRLRSSCPGLSLTYVGRPASASPATGSLSIHRREQRNLVAHALGI